MKLEELEARIALRDLVDRLAVLGDHKDAKTQGEYFTEDAVLEFQIGEDGEVGHLDGRNAIVEGFANSFAACQKVYHLNGQFVVDFTDDTFTKAHGVSYVQARTSSLVDGKEVIQLSSEFYTDDYVRLDGKWYIQKRRTTFVFMENQ